MIEIVLIIAQITLLTLWALIPGVPVWLLLTPVFAYAIYAVLVILLVVLMLQGARHAPAWTM